MTMYLQVVAGAVNDVKDVLIYNISKMCVFFGCNLVFFPSPDVSVLSLTFIFGKITVHRKCSGLVVAAVCFLHFPPSQSHFPLPFFKHWSVA